MAVEYEQDLCHRCGRLTMHVRNTYDVPHIGHLLVTIFTLGFWLPIWFLHCLVNLWSSEPFRCQACGQAAGELTGEQKAGRRAAARQDAEHRYRERMAAGAEGRKRFAAFARKAGLLARRIVAGAGTLPGRYDRLLLAMAGGPDNSIIYGFLWVLSIGTLCGALVGAMLALAVS